MPLTLLRLNLCRPAEMSRGRQTLFLPYCGRNDFTVHILRDHQANPGAKELTAGMDIVRPRRGGKVMGMAIAERSRYAAVARSTFLT